MVADAWLAALCVARFPLPCSAFCSVAPLSSVRRLVVVAADDFIDRSNLIDRSAMAFEPRPSVGLGHVADIFGGVADENDTHTSTLSERPRHNSNEILACCCLRRPSPHPGRALSTRLQAAPSLSAAFRPRQATRVRIGLKRDDDWTGRSTGHGLVGRGGLARCWSRCSAVEAIPLSGAALLDRPRGSLGPEPRIDTNPCPPHTFPFQFHAPPRPQAPIMVRATAAVLCIWVGSF